MYSFWTISGGKIFGRLCQEQKSPDKVSGDPASEGEAVLKASDEDAETQSHLSESDNGSDSDL